LFIRTIWPALENKHTTYFFTYDTGITVDNTWFNILYRKEAYKFRFYIVMSTSQLLRFTSQFLSSKAYNKNHQTNHHWQ
jgi:hypothetical protein